MAITESQWSDWVEIVEDLRDDCGIPGAAVALVSDGRQIMAHGCGVRDVHSRQPVTPQTMFHIASSQKPMTSMFIATLVDQDLFGWDTPVVEIVPQFQLSDPGATQAVTMRHLLSMSSGIPAAGEDSMDDPSLSPEQLLSSLTQIPLASRPGKRFDYSNISYAVAGYIGTLAAGGTWGNLESDFARAMADRVFVPAGMRSATFSLAAAQGTADCCAPHDREGGRLEVMREHDGPDALAPSGAVRVNATEMGHFLATELNAGVSPASNQVVSAANVQARWQPQITDPQSGASYGLGWGISEHKGRTVLMHEGSFGGFASLLAMIPDERLGLAILANFDQDEYFIEDTYTAWLEELVPRKGLLGGWFS
jgi:CubicO group peptidase (beta-lactamase class C family)